MGNRTAQMRLTEILIGEPLRPYLQRRREEGLSWRQIERELLAMTNGEVDVTQVTLREWFARLEHAA